MHIGWSSLRFLWEPELLTSDAVMQWLYHLALSFRRRDYSSILHIAVSPIHQYRSEPSLHFYSLWYYYFHSVLKGQFTQQWKFCLHLLTLLSLQTFMFGIVWGGMLRKSIATVWLPTFFKISYFLFSWRKNLIQVCSDMRVSTWWQNFYFWVN